MTNEALYNGIILPQRWPPRDVVESSREPIPVPYLANPPEVIPIDLGRQLFVDDFLIDETSLRRAFGKPEIHAQSPVLQPETEEEMDSGFCPMAAPFNDGAWYDPQDRLFKLWYMPGWFRSTALATSADGIHWERPQLDITQGTNLVWPNRVGSDRDGCLVWLDSAASDDAQRFKMFQYYRHYKKGREDAVSEGWVHVSPDGIHWSEPVITTQLGDNSSFFYNPFRRKWCMSIRRAARIDASTRLRARFYSEADDFLRGAQWDRDTEEVFWQRIDRHDLPDPARPDHRVALYDVNVTPYESLMLGMFAIFRGPENDICAAEGVPKTMDLELAYSRDGFHFSRPDRTPFLASSRKRGDWNRAYLHACGGVCLVVHDRIFIYFAGFSGLSPKLGPSDAGSSGLSRRVMYAGASTGSGDSAPGRVRKHGSGGGGRYADHAPGHLQRGSSLRQRERPTGRAAGVGAGRKRGPGRGADRRRLRRGQRGQRLRRGEMAVRRQSRGASRSAMQASFPPAIGAVVFLLGHGRPQRRQLRLYGRRRAWLQRWPRPA